MSARGSIRDLPELRDRVRVFRDRADAGRVLAALVATDPPGPDCVLLAVPSGGVPVAAALGAELGLTVDVAVVSKITPSWDTEVGYGAVAFDGTVRLDEGRVAAFGITPDEAREGTAATRAKVARRVRLFRGTDAPPALAGRPALLVDDGLASGLTMLLAAEAVRRLGASSVAVAVPTAHVEAAERVAAHVDLLWCASLRRGRSFAVADAYRNWRDVPEEEALAALRRPPGPRRR